MARVEAHGFCRRRRNGDSGDVCLLLSQRLGIRVFLTRGDRPPMKRKEEVENCDEGKSVVWRMVNERRG